MKEEFKILGSPSRRPTNRRLIQAGKEADQRMKEFKERKLIKKDFKPICQACDIEMTHWAKDYRSVFCTSCWESVPVPLDTVPNYVKLAETRRLRDMVESREESDPTEPYRPTRRRRPNVK